MNVQWKESNVVVDTVGPQMPISEGSYLLLGTLTTDYLQNQPLQQGPGQPRVHI